ncbi:MAG TPA: tetratricopeptide repeat protein [Candidatus Saccharimonadales bacterium]|nr:tetratricopeptide repeat protein [Candidatus Saccharimonadales bacterium]
MYTVLLVAAFGGLAIWAFFRDTSEAPTEQIPTRITEKLDKLWQIAQEGLRDKKYLSAEKALLTILRVDERNAAAYNRLGILYAKQRAFNDAIECFEIAQSLEPSASSLHNVGLIYYETGQYEKAAMAFEQAIEMESGLAARYIAYAKVQEKMRDHKKMVASLEKAVELEPNPQSLRILAEAYERTGDLELAETIHKKIEKLTAAQSGAPRQIRQPRKMVM